MKKKIWKTVCLILVSGALLAGCGESSETELPDSAGDATEEVSVSTIQPEAVSADETEDDAEQAAAELVVRFGDAGDPFTMHLYENDTATAIARHVGTSDWRLPIYHYDDYDNWEVMQYYDIPSRYDIPSEPEEITEEKAGAVYYSEPNRIILFYQDAEVPAEYTPVGYFDYTDEFLQAVLDNPVLEGWGNKIIRISDEE